VAPISLDQAEAYASWLRQARDDPHEYAIPTVAQYLRAGRGDATSRYPWDDNPNRPDLICDSFRYSESRPVSLLGRLGRSAPPIVGLVGNVLEFVRDTESGRLLRAGGCYVMPASACTLDSFLDADWFSIDVVIGDGADSVNVPVRPASFTGFRLVRQLDR